MGRRSTFLAQKASTQTLAGQDLPIQALAERSFRVKLHVKPAAKVSRFTDISPEAIGLQIAAPPRDGEANIEAVRYVAEAFHRRIRQTLLIGGIKSRDKILRIEFDEDEQLPSVEELLDLVKACINKKS